LQQLTISELLPGTKQSAELCSVGTENAVEIPLDLSESFSEMPAQSFPAGPRTLAQTVLPQTPFFAVLNERLLRLAIDRVSLVKLAAGEILFSRGDRGDAFYVVASGEVAILVPHEVARLGEGEFFGEIAIMAGGRRTATAQATMETHVLAFDHLLLADLMAESPALLTLLLGFVRDRLLSTLVETSPLFAPFTPLERIALVTSFQFIEAAKHARLVEEGVRSPGLFILVAGEAAVISGRTPIARLEPGDVFGEMSLILGQVSQATVVCLEKSYVLFMPRSAFSELIMTHPQVLEYVGQLAESRLQAIGRLQLV
jgi:cAMP-dependent protein kinase regulator